MDNGQLILWGLTIFGAGSVVGAGLAALGIDFYTSAAERRFRRNRTQS